MMDIIMKHFLPNFILVSSLIYIWHILLNKKINFKDSKLYLTTIGLMFTSISNYLMVNKFVKITIITIIFMFFFKYLFNEKIQKCIITPIYYQILIMISESLYALLIIMLNIDINSTINSSKINMISNIIIAFVSIFLSKMKFIRNVYNKLLDATDKVNYIQLTILCIIVMMIANILSMIVYYKIQFEYLLIFNVSMTLICCGIVIYSFITKNNYNKVSDKYNIAINSLNDYEDMMGKYRIANHENKNLLLAIRAMIINGDKEIPKYIDSIIKNKYNDNEKLLFKMNVIPSGGLRATIYSEMLKIKNNKIDYILNIDKNLKTVDLIELDTNEIIDICKIIGVFVDNAIEEVINLSQKKIGIDLFLDENMLNIKVSNNYQNKIEIDKMYENGYTTKGDGHGYGLLLVKKIVENNHKLKNTTEISKNFFSQVLSIRYKKSR